ncbi:MAG: sensor histidine kinase [Pseudoflavonifractor sp.]
MSLRSKITAAFLGCILLAFAPLLYLMNTQVRQMNMEQSERQALIVVESKAAEISSWLNQRISELRIIQEYPACKHMDLQALKPYITGLNQVLQDQYGNPFETFAVGGTDGLGWVSSSITINVSQRDYFKEAMVTDKEYVISAPVISKSDQLPIFLICYPIRNGGQTLGFINGSVNIGKIAQVAREMKLYGGDAWVMDRAGHMYTSDEHPAFEGAQGEALLAQLDPHSGGSLPLDRDHILFYAPVPLSENLLLCTAVEKGVIHAQTDLTIRMVAIVCGMMLVLACVLAVLISRTMTRPLEKLSRSMAQLSAGDLDVVFDGAGQDEVSVLGREFNRMVGQIRDLLDRVVSIQSQKRVAELKTLQSQINPHFLYNTLDTLQWKALEKDAFEVADLVNSLSRFFRISLSDGRELIPVADEVRHAESYLEIQKIRYKDKIEYEFRVDKAAEGYLMPKLLLQPLVENAIYHGIKPEGRKGKITVTVTQSGQGVTLCVADTGGGMEPEALKRLQDNLTSAIQTDHYGLYNINERLALWFQGAASLTIESTRHLGTRVTIHLPPAEGEVVPC